ncbi:MAG: polyprenol monophosphomannose synthase [Stackebrandtia sp.]
MSTSSGVDGEVGAQVGRTIVVVPTYNEADNVAGVVGRLRKAAPGVHVLIVDDDSPDGTGDVADGLAADDDQVHVLHRPVKDGLGAAYVAGFAWAGEHDFDVVVEMDADGSHAPEQLPRLLGGLADADVVIGSRYVAGGKVVNWPVHRLLLSRGANVYAKALLNIPVNDATAGFRAYRMPVLDKILPGWTPPQGYCFQIELAWRAARAGFQVVEVPITFVQRRLGASKMSSAVVQEALWRVTAWGVRDRYRRAVVVLTGKKPRRS